VPNIYFFGTKLVATKFRVRPAAFDLMKQTFYAETRERASVQTAVPIGTIGTIDTETRAGHQYAYWRYLDANGLAVREYIGGANREETANTIQSRTDELADWKALATASKELRALGFSFADQPAATVLGAIFNAGLFGGGAVLIGSHAYAAILNGLGYREPANYLTEDVDIARAEKIKLATEVKKSWHDVLSGSGLKFLPVPELKRGLKRGDPPTNYKVAGKALRVDLLAPSRRSVIENVPIPELDANATALPHLGHLLGGDRFDGIILAKDKVVPVRLPSPSRFCVNKLIVAGLRPRAQATKRLKDLKQAGSIACALFDAGYEQELNAAVGELSAIRRREAIVSLEKLLNEFLRHEHSQCATFLIEIFK
jgi:hypothetical protein